MRAPAVVIFLSLLVVTFGSVLVLTNDQPRQGRTASVRRSVRRYLYNYSSNKSSSSSSSSSNGNNGGSSNYMNPNYSYDSSNPYGNSDSSSSSGSSSSNSGSAYSNAASYNSQNSANQNYENSNYVWQSDDDDDVYDNNENWNSNHNYKASGSGNYYNGRGSNYGGQAVQQANEDEAEVEVVGGDDSWLKSMTLKETISFVILVTITSLFFILLLGYSGHVFDIWGMCCGHKKVDETTTLGDTIEDGFVKIGDF